MDNTLAQRVLIRWLLIKFKFAFKVFKTNWVNVFGLFAGLYLSTVLYGLLYEPIRATDLVSLLVKYLVAVPLEAIVYNSYYCIQS